MHQHVCGQPLLNLRAWCVYIKDKMLGNYTYEDTPIIKITQIKPLIDHHLPSTIQRRSKHKVHHGQMIEMCPQKIKETY